MVSDILGEKPSTQTGFLSFGQCASYQCRCLAGVRFESVQAYHPSLVENSAGVRFELRIQPVDATLAANRSAGVSKFSVSRGRSLSCLATALSLFWWMAERSIPFGKDCLYKPLVFSFDPRCQGLSGSQK